MPLLPPWTAELDPQGVRAWRAPAPEASLRPAPGGVCYQRPGQEGGALLSEALAARLRWELRLGTETLLVALDTPVIVAAGGAQELWVEIPLVRALVAEGSPEPLDLLRPGARRAVLGRVDSGSVLPAVRGTLRQGPEDPLRQPWTAALRVRVQSRAEVALTLRRVPVHEPTLRLWRRGELAACGDVGVVLEDGLQAEARAEPGDPPPGWQPVDDEPARAAVPALSWLLDPSRRALEFQP